MPIYEYVCEACGNEFEVMQKFSDPALKTHDCAPKAKVRRKLSLNAFHLQGGGWSAGGYGKGSSGKNGSSDKSASAAKSESGAAGKSESGPAAKSESSTAGKTESGGASKSEAGVSAAGSCAGGCACH
jgi:putative FmdB family regulatory protein